MPHRRSRGHRQGRSVLVLVRILVRARPWLSSLDIRTVTISLCSVREASVISVGLSRHRRSLTRWSRHYPRGSHLRGLLQLVHHLGSFGLFLRGPIDAESVSSAPPSVSVTSLDEPSSSSGSPRCAQLAVMNKKQIKAKTRIVDFPQLILLTSR